MSASRAPDYHLKALNKRTDERSGKLGAAWLNSDGSISLVLDMCTSLVSNPDLVLTLFPTDQPAEGWAQKARNKKAKSIKDSPVSTSHRINTPKD